MLVITREMEDRILGIALGQATAGVCVCVVSSLHALLAHRHNRTRVYLIWVVVIQPSLMPSTHVQELEATIPFRLSHC